MNSSTDLRRHHDGSIDFDYYRRAAARERADVLHVHFGRVAGAIRKTLASLVRPRRTFFAAGLRAPALTTQCRSVDHRLSR